MQHHLDRLATLGQTFLCNVLRQKRLIQDMLARNVWSFYRGSRTIQENWLLSYKTGWR